MERLEKENKELREYIRKLEKRLEEERIKKPSENNSPEKENPTNTINSFPLTKEQVARYSRHLLLPQIGVKGQQKLINGSILIVGAGGLGSPAAMYLAAAGVGRIGFVDFDIVDSSNLHRQIIHKEDREGIPKVLSAKMSCLSINSNIKVDVYNEPLTENNALDIIKQYDVVIDGSDNVSTRYLVNDACVMAKKPLVSGCAVRFEGQLTVYNYKNGPCYRCLYPIPPPPETVTNCANNGVFGVVPGVIGCLQALEAQKILMGAEANELLCERMLMFNGMTSTIRTARIRKRSPNCPVCGDNPTITKLTSVQNVTCQSNVKRLDDKNRITVHGYKQVLQDKVPHLLLDVRAPHQFEICSLPNAINIPLKELPSKIEQIKEKIVNDNFPVYVICRRGNDSITGTQILLKEGIQNVMNIDGGVTEWAKSIDSTFPIY